MSVVISYTYPSSGIVKQVQKDSLLPYATPTRVPLYFAAKMYAATVTYVPSKLLTMRCLEERLQMPLASHPQRPPLPPLGKQLINTFPSIYKEAGLQESLATVARVFPPIFIEHIAGE